MSKLLTLICLLSLLVSSSVYGVCTKNQCTMPEDLCDKALQACQLYAGSLEEQVKALDTQNTLFKAERDEAYHQLSKESGNPDWYWYVLGGVVGGVVLGRAIK